MTAIQKVPPLNDIAIANSVLLLFQQLGPAVFVAAAQTLLLNQLVPQMQAINPALTSIQIVQAGAIGVKDLVQYWETPRFLVAYAKTLSGVFIVAAGLGGVAVLPTFRIEWKNIKPKAK